MFDVFHVFCEYWGSDASIWSWWHLISCLVPINHWRRRRTRKWRKSNLEGWKNCGKRDGKTFHVFIRETHRSRMFVFAKMFPLLRGLSDVSAECLAYVMFYLLSLFPLDLITFCLFWSPTFLPQRRKTLDFFFFFAQKNCCFHWCTKKNKKKNKWMKTRLHRETQISDCVSLKGFPVYSDELTKKKKKNESSWVKNK